MINQYSTTECSIETNNKCDRLVNVTLLFFSPLFPFAYSFVCFFEGFNKLPNQEVTTV